MESPVRSAVVCDDDALIRSVLSRLLEDCNVSLVGEADTAVRAIDLVERTKPTLVIVDVAMPGMSGLEAIPVLRRVAPECEVIVCSAFELSLQAAQDAGAIAVFDKTKLVDLEAFLNSGHLPADSPA